MKNNYRIYQNFMIQQPFFSFDVKSYQEKLLKKPFAARFYEFSTHKVIDRKNNGLFMCCIPDGCVDVVFIRHNQRDNVELIGSPFCQKSLIVYPDAAYFGVRLKPGMFFPGEPVCLKEVTNTETFIPQIAPEISALMEQIFTAQTLEERINLFQAYLLQFAPEQYTVDETVQNILYLTSLSKGTLEINSIAKKICYSERHLTRMFSDAMGYSPKMFARIARFQYALGLMMEHTSDSVSSFIDTLNYADQAHFQREFKEFTGMTPKHFTQYYAESVCPETIFPVFER